MPFPLPPVPILIVEEREGSASGPMIWQKFVPGPYSIHAYAVRGRTIKVGPEIVAYSWMGVASWDASIPLRHFVIFQPAVVV